jgi:hypothetical protein
MRKTEIMLGIVALSLAAGSAGAQESNLAFGGEPTDGSARHGAIEVTPLGLFLGHYGAQVELVPLPHHGLVLAGYYARTESPEPMKSKDDVPPVHVYQGGGAELGYRYYFGALGPHGLYLGPSVLGGSYHTDALGGVSFRTWGGALDVGYQSILGPLLVGVSVGAQYLYVDRAIPVTGDFTDAMTQSALRPRVAFTGGWAF